MSMKSIDRDFNLFSIHGQNSSITSNRKHVHLTRFLITLTLLYHDIDQISLMTARVLTVDSNQRTTTIPIK